MAKSKHRKVELVTLAPSLEFCPEAKVPEFAFSGRSNVGKSSLLNMLVGRKKLAYVSGDPGKTRTLTFYGVDDKWHLVDMPGYGYARVSQTERQRWAKAARAYLFGREQLAGVLQLVDIRVGLTPDDRARVRALLELQKPFCLVMTKADKITRSRQDEQVAEHVVGLGLPEDTAVIVTSAKEGYGVRELWAWIEDHMPPGRDPH